MEITYNIPKLMTVRQVAKTGIISEGALSYKTPLLWQ